MSLDYRGMTFIKVDKIFTLILGVVVLGVGLHSHYQSSWVKPVSLPNPNPQAPGVITMKTYKICENKLFKLVLGDKQCPSIAMEQYFVAIIILCFVVSLIIFVAGFLIDMGSSPIIWVDIGYHGAAAILLLIAGAVYIVSAIQIDNLIDESEINKLLSGYLDTIGVNFRKTEKLAAGSLAIINSLAYAAVAIQLARGRKDL